MTLEDVLEIVDKENPKGVIVQFGGQTPLKLARALEAKGVPIIGTTPDCIDLAEDRERFQKMIEELGLRSRPTAPRAIPSRRSSWRAKSAIRWWCVPRMCWAVAPWRSSISEEDLRRYMRDAVQVSNDSPVLLDRFLDDAVEVDVDAVADGEQVLIGGIMEHIEAGRRAFR